MASRRTPSNKPPMSRQEESFTSPAPATPAASMPPVGGANSGIPSGATAFAIGPNGPRSASPSRPLSTTTTPTTMAVPTNYDEEEDGPIIMGKTNTGGSSHNGAAAAAAAIASSTRSSQFGSQTLSTVTKRMTANGGKITRVLSENVNEAMAEDVSTEARIQSLINLRRTQQQQQHTEDGQQVSLSGGATSPLPEPVGSAGAAAAAPSSPLTAGSPKSASSSFISAAIKRSVTRLAYSPTERFREDVEAYPSAFEVVGGGGGSGASGPAVNTLLASSSTATDIVGRRGHLSSPSPAPTFPTPPPPPAVASPLTMAPPLSGGVSKSSGNAGTMGSPSAAPPRSGSPERGAVSGGAKRSNNPGAAALAAVAASRAAATASTANKRNVFTSPSPPPTPAIIKDIEANLALLSRGGNGENTTVSTATAGAGGAGNTAANNVDSKGLTSPTSISMGRRSLSPSRPVIPTRDDLNGGSSMPRSRSRTRGGGDVDGNDRARRSASPSRTNANNGGANTMGTNTNSNGGAGNNNNSTTTATYGNALMQSALFGIVSPADAGDDNYCGGGGGDDANGGYSASATPVGPNPTGMSSSFPEPSPLPFRGGAGGGFNNSSTTTSAVPNQRQQHNQSIGVRAPTVNNKNGARSIAFTSPSPAPVSVATGGFGVGGISNSDRAGATASVVGAGSVSVAGGAPRTLSTATVMEPLSGGVVGGRAMSTLSAPRGADDDDEPSVRPVEADDDGEHILSATTNTLVGGRLSTPTNSGSGARVGGGSLGGGAVSTRGATATVSPDVDARKSGGIAIGHSSNKRSTTNTTYAAPPHNANSNTSSRNAAAAANISTVQMRDLEDTFAAAPTADNENDNEAGGPLSKKALKRAQKQHDKQAARQQHQQRKATQQQAIAGMTTHTTGADGTTTTAANTATSAIRSFFNNVIVKKERTAIEKRFADEMLSEDHADGRFFEHDPAVMSVANSRAGSVGSIAAEDATLPPKMAHPNTSSSAARLRRHRHQQLPLADRFARYVISAPLLMWLTTTRKGLIALLVLQTIVAVVVNAVFF